MPAVDLQKQWAEMEPQKGFSFENYERNLKLVKDKVNLFHANFKGIKTKSFLPTLIKISQNENY